MARICSGVAILLIVMTTSMMGMRLNDKSTTMANEFLISKWRLWYKSLDVNHDGKVSMADVQECEKKIFEMDHLDAEKRKHVEEDFDLFWYECLFRGKKGVISEQNFVDSLITDFNADSETFRKEVNSCYDMGFSITDINDDKYISKDEFQIRFAAFGHPNISKDSDFFSAYNPSNDLVDYRVVVDSWVDFITSTDESKDNIILSRFTADGFD